MEIGDSRAAHIDAAHRLPIEILQQICLLAANTDRHCAQALACVSKATCEWTKLARLRSVTITSIRQFILFSVLIRDDQTDQWWGSVASHLVPAFPTLDDLHIDSTANRVLNKRISLPCSSLTSHVENILVDIARPASTTDSKSALELLREAIDAYFSRADHINDPLRCFFLPWYKSTSGGPYKLQNVTLGEGAYLLLENMGIGSIKSLTMIYDYSDNTDTSYMIFQHFYGLKDIDLQRLHLIGHDRDGAMCGIPLPWQFLLNAGDSTFWRKKGLTHFRYDTRRFSFKPVEIFASRLRPLLQEMTVKMDSQNGQIRRQHTRQYQYSGPPHAAPTYGAGNSRYPRHSSLTPVQDIQDDFSAQFLREQYGTGHLDFMQLAWEPMKSVPSETSSTDINVRKAENTIDSFDSGGWPNERKGAWTDRLDRNVKRSLSDQMLDELKDAIVELYGWDAPNAESAYDFVVRKARLSPEEQRTLKNNAFSPDGSGIYLQRIKDGFTPFDRELLGVVRDRIRADWEHNGDASETSFSDHELQYGTRAPKSLLHLGGRVPFTPEDRLKLFDDQINGGTGPWPD